MRIATPSWHFVAISNWSAAIALTLIGVAALAADFPAGSVPLTPDALSNAVAGKVFSVKASKGPVWRWQFTTNGAFAIAIGDFADEGRWSTKGSSLCTEGKKIKFSCNEVRTLTTELYLLRDNGEIIKLEAQ